MSRRTWRKDTISITYGNADITPRRERLLKSMDDVMYFYYDIDILDGNKILFSASASDFPKVQDLPCCIDYLVNMEETDMLLYEDYKYDGFHRKKLYNLVILNDSFDMEVEYFYKIERFITYVKQRNEEDYKRYEEFTLTIGQNAPSKEGYSNGENFGQSIFIKHLTKDDMLRLKQTAINFCNSAIEDYNKYLKEYKIKCPKCEAHQLYLDSLLPLNNKSYNEEFKCVKCGYEFKDDEDYEIN